MPKLNHMGLTVRNLGKSLDFYRDVIGAQERMRTEAGGEWFDQLTENRGARLSVAHVGIGAFQLQLVEYTAAGGDALALAHRHPGNPHLCIEVEDLDARYRTLRQAGVHKLSPLVDIGDTGHRSFYITDPDGVLVELIEVPANA